MKLLLYGFILSILFISCKKGDNEPGGQHIVLSKINYGNGKPAAIFTYNGSQLAKAQFYLGYLPSSLPTTEAETHIFSYNEQGQLYVVTINNAHISRMIFKYNSNNIDTLSHLPAPGGSEIHYKINYQNNKMTGWRQLDNYSANGIPTALFTYNNDGCITSCVYTDQPLQVSSIENFTFDNKRPLTEAIPNWDYFFLSREALLSLYTSGVHNILTAKKTTISSTATTTVNFTYTYEYNSDGYPSKLTFNDGLNPAAIYTFEYIKVK